jgi:signal transduction histidine kinase
MINDLRGELTSTRTSFEQRLESFIHDLKSPLAAALGFAELLEVRNSDKLDDSGKKYLTAVLASVRKVSAVMEKALVESRAKFGSYAPFPSLGKIEAELKPARKAS